MKISLASDLHLEFDPKFRLKNPGSDVLILSGDICVVNHFLRSKDSPYHEKANQYRDFFNDCAANWDMVFVVMGNHEYYHGYIDTYAEIYRKELSYWPNIVLLNKNSFEYKGYLFTGHTLWTNLNQHDPIAEYTVKANMNDFHIIQWSKTYYKFNPFQSATIHYDALEYLDKTTREYDGPVVLCSHHAPSERSIDVRYKEQTYMNYAYYSNLEKWIEEHDNIVLWTHGHVHNQHDYTIGSTRVVANPKGYPNETGVNFNDRLIIEV